MASINRGDNTGAFGNDFLRIYINNPNNLFIKRALVQINGNLEKEFYEPAFPLRINFSGAETELLEQINVCKLVLWDEYGRRRTADGKFTFFVKENPINSPDEPTGEEGQEPIEDNSIIFNLTDSEFAAQFIINATPTKFSELEQDVPYLQPENVIGRRNVHTFREGDNVIIEADMDMDMSYNNLLDLPSINGNVLKGDMTIECEQVNADWLAETGKAQILNKPEFADVAFSGNAADLINLPEVPTRTSELVNDTSFITESSLQNFYTKEEVDTLVEKEVDLKEVYDAIEQVAEKEQEDILQLQNDLNEKITLADVNPTIISLKEKDQELTNVTNLLNENIEEVASNLEEKASKKELADVSAKITEGINQEDLEEAIKDLATKEELTDGLAKKLNKTSLNDGILTIAKNGEVQGQFSANNKQDVTVDIAVPSKLSELENDSKFVTKEEVSLDNFVTQAELADIALEKADRKDIGSGILSIQVNNDLIGSFNANAKENKSININVPTKSSDLEQDIAYLNQEDLTPINLKIEDVQNSLAVDEAKIEACGKELGDKLDKKPGYGLVPIEEIARLENVNNYDDTELVNKVNNLQETVDNFDNNIENKVDKVEGKGLSTNDYSDEERNTVALNRKEIEVIKDETTSLTNDMADWIASQQDLTTDYNDFKEEVIDAFYRESKMRLDKDNDLQSQIDAMEAKSDVVDILATTDDLAKYDTSALNEKDVLCILKDSLHNDTVSYYRWVNKDFEYIGSEGQCYSKAEADDRFISSSITINGHSIKQDVNLTYKDVKALPESTVIGEGLLTVYMKDASYAENSLNLDKELSEDVLNASEDSYFLTLSEYNLPIDYPSDSVKEIYSIFEKRLLSIELEGITEEQYRNIIVGIWQEAANTTRVYYNRLYLEHLDDTLFRQLANTTWLEQTIGELNYGQATPEYEKFTETIQDGLNILGKTLLGTFGANDVAGKVITIPVPTDLSDLTNYNEYITKDVLLDTYLGRDIPENTLIQDEIDSLQTSIQALQGNLPTVALDGNYYSLRNLPTTISSGYKNAMKNQDYTGYIDNTFVKELKAKTKFLTMDDADLQSFATKSELPKYVSQLENDRGYVTPTAIGKADLTIKLAEETLGSFNANANVNNTIIIPVDLEMSDTSINPVQNTVIKAYVDEVDNNAVHISGDENIEGTKIIDSLQSTTQDNEDNSTNVATTEYVKNQDYCTNTSAVHKDTEETITGNKTFTGDVVLSNATGITMANIDSSTNLATTAFVKNLDYCTNADAVHKQGDETINGDKTFAETTTFQGITTLGDFAHVSTPDGTVLDAVANVEFVQTTDLTALHKEQAETVTGVKTYVSNSLETPTLVLKNNVDTPAIKYMSGENVCGFLGIHSTKVPVISTNGTSIDKAIVTSGWEEPTGSATVPVYIDAKGQAVPITSYSGNAATATKATQDAKGNVIDNTYATKSELNAYATTTSLQGYVSLETYNSKVNELTQLIETLSARLAALENTEPTE